MQGQALGGRLSRRAVVGGLAALGVAEIGLALFSACGLGSSAAQVRSIGTLSGSSRDASRIYWEAFLAGMRDLGWNAGQNLRIEWRFGNGSNDQLDRFADELRQMQVDVIVTSATQATIAAKRATTTIPIVMTSAADPVGSGLIDSLAHPGGNVTGLSFSLGPALSKGIEWLERIVPRLSRLALVYDHSNEAAAAWMPDIRATAQAMQFEILDLDARTPEDLASVFEAARVWRADALCSVPEPAFVTGEFGQRFGELARAYRLPSTHANRSYVLAGGLMSYNASSTALYRRSAAYVDKILHGSRPADMPVEQPREFEFTISVETAQLLGLTVPPDVAAQVTEWIG